MYETNYRRAASTDEAVRMMGAAGDGKFLAGGQTLLPTTEARDLAQPSELIEYRQDIGHAGHRH